MSWRPMAEFLIVAPRNTDKKNNLYLPESKSGVADVVAVGDETRRIRPGDIVLYDKRNEIKHDALNDGYVMLQVTDVLAVEKA